MEIILGLIAFVGVVGALSYGFYERKKSKQRSKDMINAMSLEDRQAYYASIEQKQAEYLEEIKKRP